MTTSSIKNQTLDAQEIVRQIDDMAYDILSDRPFCNYNEKDPLPEVGMKLADFISHVIYIYKAKAEALHEAGMSILKSPEFLDNPERNIEIVLDLITQAKVMLDR